MLSCSFGVIAKKYPDYSVFGLLGVVVAQGQLEFPCRWAKLISRSRLRTLVRSIILPPKLECSRWITHGPLRLFTEQEEIVCWYPLAQRDRQEKVVRQLLVLGLEIKLIISFQLAGRILLIFLFIGFIFQGKWSFARVVVSIVGLGACIMVAVGFKAKWSASFLVTLLSVFNVFINNW